MTDAPENPGEARIRELEDALAYIGEQARSAKGALCENELAIRLDNILRRIRSIDPDGRLNP